MTDGDVLRRRISFPEWEQSEIEKAARAAVEDMEREEVRAAADAIAGAIATEMGIPKVS